MSLPKGVYLFCDIPVFLKRLPFMSDQRELRLLQRELLLRPASAAHTSTAAAHMF
jgi:hypothetical protein